ncbi:MAG: hypothetical protein ACOZBW_01615 [Thermodesulfobacteriota bacterium]
MLYEIKKVSQHPGEPRRRWFFDHEIDLTVWFDPAGKIESFQLCYDKPGDPHALSWSRDGGYGHHRVDDGEDGGGAGKGIPILLADGRFDSQRIAGLFDRKSRDIPRYIARFVSVRIASCGEQQKR